MNKLLKLVFVALISAVSIFAASADEVSLESASTFLPRVYGFTIKDTDAMCNTKVPQGSTLFGKLTSGGVCESGLGTSNYMLVMWRSFKKSRDYVAMQTDVINQMVAKNTSTKPVGELRCKAAEFPKDEKSINLKAAFVDCVNVFNEEVPGLSKFTYITFFYFTPKKDSAEGNVLVFSDFGKGGENAEKEVIKRAREIAEKIEITQ